MQLLWGEVMIRGLVRWRPLSPSTATRSSCMLPQAFGVRKQKTSNVWGGAWLFWVAALGGGRFQSCSPVVLKWQGEKSGLLRLSLCFVLCASKYLLCLCASKYLLKAQYITSGFPQETFLTFRRHSEAWGKCTQHLQISEELLDMTGAQLRSHLAGLEQVRH